MLEQVGRTVAPLPCWRPSCGRRAHRRFGTDEQRSGGSRRPSPVATILTAALVEPGNRSRPAPGDDGDAATATAGVLDGVKTCVPAGHAGRRRRSCRPDADGRCRGVPRRPDAAGRHARPPGHVEPRPEATSSWTGVRRRRRRAARRARDGRRRSSSWLIERATLGLCAMQLGVAERGAASSPPPTPSAGAVRPGRSPRSRPSASAGRRLHRHRGASGSRRCRRRGTWTTGLPAPTRGRDRQVLGGRRRQPRRPRRAAHPRRHRHRRRLPDPPLLPRRQADRVHPRRRHRAAARGSAPSWPPSRSEPRRTGASPAGGRRVRLKPGPSRPPTRLAARPVSSPSPPARERTAEPASRGASPAVEAVGQAPGISKVSAPVVMAPSVPPSVTRFSPEMYDAAALFKKMSG